MYRPLIVVLLPSLLMIADAHAQCAPTDKIYIDPRLVPQRPQISREQLKGLVLGQPNEEFQRWTQLYMDQNQPIEIHTARARS